MTTDHSVPDDGLEQDLEARAHKDEFSLSRQRESLDKAICLIHEAIALSADSPVGRLHARLSHLGLWSLERWRSFRSAEHANDIEVAIKAFEKAVKLVPAGNPRISFSKSNLSIAIGARADRDGRQADFDEAVDLAQQALDAVSDDSEQWLPEYKNNLAVKLRTRYFAYHNLVDLENAIRLSTEAIESADEDSEQSSLYLVNLCIALTCRFERNGDPDDINTVVQLAWNALDETYPEDSFRYQFVEQLMNAFIIRSAILNRPSDQRLSDINEAIDAGLWVLEEIPVHEKGGVLLSIAFAHRARSEFLNSKSTNLQFEDRDVNLAIAYSEEAVALVDRHNHDYMLYSQELATCLLHKAQAAGSETVMAQAVHHFQEAFNVDAADVRMKLRVAHQAADSLIGIKDWARLDEMLQYSALHLLPQVAPRSLTRDDQQDAIFLYSGFSSLAASAALQNGREAFLALDLLERGRGLIADLLMAARSDISGLEEPSRSEYRDLQERLSRPIPAWNKTAKPLYAGPNDLSAERMTVFHQLKQLQLRIRKQPGHERFQLPPDLQTMKRIAGPHAIVSINLSKLRADAFIVKDGIIQVIQLPKLTLKDAEAHAKSLPEITKHNGRDATVLEEDEPSTPIERKEKDADLRQTCIWLWEVAIYPILQHLGYLDRASQCMKHICWVNSGFIGLMPFHAAGTHIPGSTTNLISHVISSYASSFKALAYSTGLAAQTTAAGAKPQRVVVVSMPTTPGGQHPELQVSEEVTAIEMSSEGNSEVTVFTQSSKAEIVAALSDCAIAHFACHGFADPYNPSDSGLLVGGSCLERLTVRELADLRRAPGTLAYLSACSTAELASHKLRDENIHLASAFQAVGFRHIIGTLWSADDTTAGFVARAFYEKLLGGDKQNTDSERRERFERYAVPSALHEAVLKARERNGSENILRWAPFLHMGW